jgi:hypothetical protein
MLVFAVGQAGAAKSSDDPKAMVLKLIDLPVGFGLENRHYVSNAKAAKEASGGASLAEYIKWGRISGYEANFAREALLGLIRVVSEANTYRSVGGARDSLHASFRAAATRRFEGYKFKRLSTGGRIGHEARLYSATVRRGGIRLAVFAVVWRYFKVKASVVGVGVAGTVTPTQLSALRESSNEGSKRSSVLPPLRLHPHHQPRRPHQPHHRQLHRPLQPHQPRQPRRHQRRLPHRLRRHRTVLPPTQRSVSRRRRPTWIAATSSTRTSRSATTSPTRIHTALMEIRTVLAARREG